MLERDVYIDCDKARKKASELRVQSGELRSVMEDIQGAADRIGSAWKGSSAQLFKRSLNGRVSSLQKSANRLEELASAIEQTANAYERRQINQIKAAREAAKKARDGGGR